MLGAYIVTLDAEQRELLYAQADMLDAMLAARAKRIDPDGVISKSLILQTKKMAQLRLQLEAGPIPRVAEVAPRTQAAIRAALRAAIDEAAPETLDAAIDVVASLLLAERARRPGLPSPHDGDHSIDDLGS